MVQIVGKYEHVSSEGLEEYLTTVGGTTQVEAAKAFAKGKPTFEIQQSGEQWIVTVTNEGKTTTNTFTLGTPYDETMPHGAVVKSVTTQSGDTFTTVTDLPNGNQSVRAYEFTDSGVTLHLSDKKVGVTATRTYKRV